MSVDVRMLLIFVSYVVNNSLVSIYHLLVMLQEGVYLMLVSSSFVLFYDFDDDDELNDDSD